MADTLCNYPGRDEHLVAYLYDDIESAEQDSFGAERTAFGAHLSTCRVCHEDLDALRGVRSTLSMWAPPEPRFVSEPRAASPESRLLSFEPRRASSEQRTANNEQRAWWHTVPVWAQVAAALLVLGVSASIANLDVRYNRSGLTITTGWSKPQPVSPTPAAEPTWRPELAALANELRAEMKSAQVAAASTPAPRAGAALAEVRAMIDESERRQEKDLAIRLAQFYKDYNAQRAADLSWTESRVRAVAATYDGQIYRQQQQLNYLGARALPVSQQQR